MTISINPIIARFGPFQIGWYGVIMALAVVVGTVVFSRELGRRGISPSHALGIAVVAVPCGVIGARVVHIFDHLGYYLQHPGQIVGTRLIGLAIYGVVLGGLAGLIIYCRWKRLPLLRVVDSTALAFPVGQIIGKCANIINGDTWGYPTHLPWGITYTNPAAYLPDNLLGVPTHPTPIYEQLWLLVVVGVLLYAVPKLKVDGLAILLYFWLYSVGRFFISFCRVNDAWLWGLREAQVIALAVIVVAPALAYLLIWRHKRRLGSGQGSGRVGQSAAGSAGGAG